MTTERKALGDTCNAARDAQRSSKGYGHRRNACRQTTGALACNILVDTGNAAIFKATYKELSVKDNDLAVVGNHVVARVRPQELPAPPTRIQGKPPSNKE